MTKEIKQIKDCLKDKDIRIKRIEDWFRLRNSILMFIGWILLCFSWAIYLFFFTNPDEIRETVNIIFAIIGMITVVVGVFIVFVFGLVKIIAYYIR
jgi:hypothetical protein